MGIQIVGFWVKTPPAFVPQPGKNSEHSKKKLTSQKLAANFKTGNIMAKLLLPVKEEILIAGGETTLLTIEDVL